MGDIHFLKYCETDINHEVVYFLDECVKSSCSVAALEQVADDAWRGLIQVIHKSEQMWAFTVKLERTSVKYISSSSPHVTQSPPSDS